MAAAGSMRRKSLADGVSRCACSMAVDQRCGSVCDECNYELSAMLASRRARCALLRAGSGEQQDGGGREGELAHARELAGIGNGCQAVPKMN